MKIEKIALIGFNRSQLLIENYKFIRTYFSGKIDLYLDGVRQNNEHDIREQKIIKTYFANVNDPNLFENYSNLNRGCRNGVIHAITESFKTSNNCIIIEDDCFVSPTFFQYFNYFLGQKNEKLVLSSKCLFKSSLPVQYFFNHSVQVWGWGCTRDVWNGFTNTSTEDLVNFWRNEYKGNFFFKWINIVNTIVSVKIDTWDYSFKSYLLYKNIKTISFNRNMVDNKGFDSGTHKTTKSLIPFFTESVESNSIKLNQSLISEFNRKDFYSIRGMFKAVINYLLFNLGFIRVGYKIKARKSF